jgi:hypothetical protein
MIHGSRTPDIGVQSRHAERASLTSDSTPPPEVRVAFWLWITTAILTAIGTAAGVALARAVTAAGTRPHDAAAGAAGGAATAAVVTAALVGLVVIAAQVLLAIHLRRGRRWARTGLTVLGVVGVLTSVLGALGSTPGAGDPEILRTGATVISVLAVVRVLLVVPAVVLPFRARAATYLRSGEASATTRT